jgi:hypothetical protein
MAIKRLKTFTVRRGSWLRGSSNGELRDERGKMCCLGFLCLAYGANWRAIEGHGMPQGVVGGSGKFPKWLRAEIYKSLGSTVPVAKNSVYVIADINDDRNIDDETRERQLTEEFAKQKLSIKFV